MDFIRNIFRMCVAWFTAPLSIWWGSNRLKVWVKKNKKEQDPTLHPFEERFEFLRKKAKGVSKRLGVRVKVEGIDFIPKGGAWITPNHSSNLDSIYMLIALGGKTEMVPIAKDDLADKFVAGNLLKGVDTMFLDTDSPRQAVTLMTGAAQYAKNRNRGVVVFPEGTRSFTTELLDFKNGTFKFAQKYFLPIVPISITGTLSAKRYFKLKTDVVTVHIHEPIKPILHSKKPTEIIGKQVRAIIQNDLDNYEKSLSDKEIKRNNKLKEKASKQMIKKEEKAENKKAKKQNKKK